MPVAGLLASPTLTTTTVEGRKAACGGVCVCVGVKEGVTLPVAEPVDVPVMLAVVLPVRVIEPVFDRVALFEAV